MNKTDCYNAGLYQQGDSLLHRLDPRLKLVLLLSLVISLFASPDFLRLLGLSAVAVCGVLTCRISFGQAIKKLSSLRWLLLFTLLLHLFFTPGRTLFGTSWLSLDGLLRGLTIDLQILLAVVFSYLLALTTSPAALSQGLTRLMAPLARVGVPVRESGGLLILVLHFLPLVREEVVSLRCRETVSGVLNRVQFAVGLVGPLLLRLIDRADTLAVEIVEGGLSLEDETVAQYKRVGLVDLYVLAVFIPLLIFLWIL